VREALAELYWERFLRAEEEGHEEDAIHYERRVRRFNDGQFDERLRGDGTLSVATRRYPCDCLIAGRTVQADEFIRRGHHLVSGRSLEDHPAAMGLPELEPGGPVTLKVHGAACEAVAHEGAHAWLFRFEEKDRILVPVHPGESTEAGGGEEPRALSLSDVLDRLYDPGSPFRPEKGLYLGTTPISGFRISMGSYLLILAAPDLAPIRVPVLVTRNSEAPLEITLYGEKELPAGFVQIPAGPFLFRGHRRNPHSGPRSVESTGDFFLSRFPVTCREYAEYLDEVRAEKPDKALHRSPRTALTAGHYWPQDDEGRLHVPTEEWISKAPEALKSAASRPDMCPVWWEDDFPVCAVSWEDMVTYAASRTDAEGRLFVLPHDVDWEKAARGTDGRFFPFGNELDASFCNINASHEGPMRPVVVDSFPVDESPYGIRGLGGNSRDFCLNDGGGPVAGMRLVRGGVWTLSGALCAAASRFGIPPNSLDYHLGGRMAWIPRLGEER
jgi:formylglycine-generating enzyme required for sulfatase activity